MISDSNILSLFDLYKTWGQQNIPVQTQAGNRNHT